MQSTPRSLALVTGAGRRMGIGAAVCRALAQRRIDICFTTWRPYDESMSWGAETEWPEEFRKELGELGVATHHIEINLSEPVSAEQLMNEVNAAMGMVGILVNNAAHSVDAGIEEIDARLLDDHYAVNLRAMALLSALFVKQWSGDAGGRIVNLTSGQSLGPMPLELPYVATKGAIEAFTMSLAPAVAGRGITVNAVNPGPTDTGWMTSEIRESLLPRFHSGRIGTPADAARLIAFLCSKEAAWITGQVINSEGGFTRG